MGLLAECTENGRGARVTLCADTTSTHTSTHYIGHCNKSFTVYSACVSIIPNTSFFKTINRIRVVQKVLELAWNTG
jgi:hypothetical protein